MIKSLHVPLSIILPFRIIIILSHSRSTSFILCEANNTEFKIARCFSFISEYLPFNIHYAVGNFVRDALSKKHIVIKSDGKDIRSYQDVSDTVEWLSFMLCKDFEYKMINVGSDKRISILQLAQKIKFLINPSAEIILENKTVKVSNFVIPNAIANIL